MTTSKNIYRKRGAGSVSSSGHINIGVGGTKRGQHVLIAEKVLGRALPAGAEVHHVNEIPSDNRHTNLVVCPDRAYHKLLHARTRALNECGHADWHKCSYCGSWDAPLNLREKKRVKAYKTPSYHHVACYRSWWANYRWRVSRRSYDP